MNSAVSAALISSSAALVIAVVGIIATGVAQSRATTKAHKNALDLFERQETARRRDAHLETKRDLYSRLPLLVDEYAEAMARERVAWKEYKGAENGAHDEQAWAEAQENWARVFGANKALRDSVYSTLEHLRILAPKPVTDAADRWVKAGAKRANAGSVEDRKRAISESVTAAVAYRRAVRTDLGVDPA